MRISVVELPVGFTAAMTKDRFCLLNRGNIHVDRLQTNGRSLIRADFGRLQEVRGTPTDYDPEYFFDTLYRVPDL
jgi:hypothetical protein